MMLPASQPISDTPRGNEIKYIDDDDHDNNDDDNDNNDDDHDKC